MSLSQPGLPKGSVPGRGEIDNSDIADFPLSKEPHWLLDSGNHAYVTIKVGGGAYRGNSPILASRWPVFKVIHSHDMLEAQHDEVLISDVVYYVFRKSVSFLDTGRSSNLTSMADSFFLAAKYCLRGLRDMCAEAFIEILDVENAGTAFILADRHNAVVLRSRAIEYICAHRSEAVEPHGCG
ncbi:speckle-type POZ protein B-like [Amblyomma americanum]